MSAAKHTPGPWRAYDEYPEIIEFSTKGGGDFGGMKVSVSGINYRTGMHVMAAEQAANMRLIAAAPDLLESLQDLADAAQARENPMGDPCALLAAQANLRDAAKRARAAISKATGSEP
jgi:hypothetical protein